MKHRDKESMQTFDCSGWLHITVSDQSDIASIKLDHHDAHIPYCPIEIPEDIVTYIHDNLKMMPAQVCLNLIAITNYFNAIIPAVMGRDPPKASTAIFYTKICRPIVVTVKQSHLETG